MKNNSKLGVSVGRLRLSTATALLAGICVLTPASSAQSTTLLGSVPTQGSPIRCVVKGRFAYLVTGIGLEIFRISTPTNPTALGSLSLPAGDKYDIAISDALYVYLPSAAFGVRIIDVANPNAPTQAGNIPLSDLGFDADFVDIEGDRLYVSSSTEGFRIFDIGTNPTVPTWLGTYNPGTSSHYFQDIEAQGNTLFAAETQKGMNVFDVSDPAAIVKLADSGIANANTWDVALLGDVAMDISLGFTPTLRFFDKTAPIPNPIPLLDAEPVPGAGISLEISAALESNGNHYAYSAHSTLGCNVWLINDPANVQLIETVPNSIGAWGVTYYRGLLLMCIDYSGTHELRIFKR